VKPVIVFMASLLISGILGCAEKNANTPVDISVFEQGLEYGTQWAVISDPYATLRGAGNFSAPVLGYGRHGDVQKITGQVIAGPETGRVLWYSFEKGWLPESSVLVFSNRFKAERAAEAFKE
jgi:hypothetical protein